MPIITAQLALLAIPAQAAPPAGFQLRWPAAFDGTKLDTTKWMYWLPGTRRHATKVPEAAVVTNCTAT